ncbi:MAG: putative metalloprotease [Candidatus Xenolissoclinum pacificiensis L6]|uniref:Endoribonuclease YbeY n=1 Tax=Candidatus Xenolissoclinum pacificiensis L6 TaxID=1401685 RepID=W2UZS6_9RICK|nr:MAG: putative metalloprotease [Candidatus Xenolissoclinum pacificiensis L6]
MEHELIGTNYSQWEPYIPSMSVVLQKILNLLNHKYPISLFLTDDPTIQSVNFQYRNKNSPTNVLSFSYLEENDLSYVEIQNLSGEIILSFDTLKRESHEYNIPFDHHATHMLVHGILHILGYDHTNLAEQQLMEKKELEILSYLNIHTTIYK